MANFMKEKMNKISQLLSEHKFTIVNDINDDYKCGICKYIINNAHQAICGCNFCLECINRFIENGGIKCPGDADECKYENLVNHGPNYQKNIQISKMIVRCLNESCYHECKLIEMEEHLRFCSMKKVKCPFNDIGCEYEEMANEKLNEHFTLNIVSHSKILVQLINHLRNEVRELKESDARNLSEIEILKDKNINKILKNNKKDEAMESLKNDITSKIMLITNSTSKDEVLELLKTEIKSIKQENQELKTLIRNNSNKLWKKFNEIDIEINDRCRNETIKSINHEMELMKIDKSKLSDKVKIIDQNYQSLNVNMKLNDSRNQEKIQMFISNEKKKNEVLESLMNEINSKNAILTANDSKIDKSIKTLNIKINSINQENQKLKISTENSKNNLWKKLDEFDIEMKNIYKNETITSIYDQIRLMKIDKIELNDQLKVLKNNFQELNENVKEIHQIKKENKEQKQEINQINKFLNMRHNGRLVWQIGKINEIKWMASDLFYNRQNPYKMRLQMRNKNDNLDIWLCIDFGEFEADHKMATLTIYIRSLKDMNISKFIEKSCTISKTNNSFYSSDFIRIAYADLKPELFDVNCLLTCKVKFE